MRIPAISSCFLFGALSCAAAGPPGAGVSSVQRLNPDYLRAVREARVRFARERQVLPHHGVYEDFRAVIHVHAEDSDHTKGTREEVLRAAKEAGVRVVMFTDHGGPKPETWRGLHEGVLFMAGEENGGAGLLRFPKFGRNGQPLPDGELRFLSHIEERYDASSEGFDGMEISNRHSDAILDKALQQYVAKAMANPEQWAKLVQDFKQFPDEFFGAGVDIRKEIIAKWDRETQGKRFTGIGANDAHQNQIFQGTTFDPYAVSFRNLTTHILARELTEEAILEALREGRAYVAHDWLCDPAGFAFGAANNLGEFTMGDSAPFLGTSRIVGTVPVAAHLKLFRNGALVDETQGTNLVFKATDTGAYRLEAWLQIAGEERPWIYSNPVYLRSPSLADLSLPSSELAPNVEAKKDIAYSETDPTDASKQKLDLYLPKGKTGAPVFFFIHGGAWKSGDRSQYPSLGNRFAKEGIVTVVPSYRLAPNHPHPAQIRDVAAAFAWVVRNIAEYGGDPRRVVIGGHSAGGHLAALLALDQTHMNAHGLSVTNLRGVVTLSGVYDLTTGDSQSSVFGSDAQERKNASPLSHIKSAALPFLVTYCQWDYLTLPSQARAFHHALQQSGLSSELVYIPGKSHISEMIHLPQENDPTATAILEFIKARER